MTVGQLMSRSIRTCHPGADIARESKHEHGGAKRPPVTVESIGDTVAVICEARGGSRDVVTAQ